MAQQSRDPSPAPGGPPQITFATIPGWREFGADEQDRPHAYQQVLYDPDLTTNTAWSLPNFTSAMFTPNATTNSLDRVFMWPRLLWLAEQKLNSNQKRMADTRNVLVIDQGRPSNTNESFGRVSGPGSMHAGLLFVFPHLFHESLLKVRDPANHPDQDVTGLLTSDLPRIISQDWTWSVLTTSMTSTTTALKAVEDARLQLVEGGLRDQFLWLEDFQTSLQDSLRHVSASRNWAQHSGQPIVDGINAALENIPEMTRLLAFIMERESTFFTHLTSEHIFGCLNDKRISLLSPRLLSMIYDIFLTANGPRFSPIPRFDTFYNFIYVRLDFLYSHMQSYQLALRDLFDYRQLVEWGYKPLYRQLYVVLSDELQISQATIQEFHTWADTSHLTQSFFAVRPVHASHFHDQTCVICMDSFVPEQGKPQGTMVVELHCSHHFHPECVITFFDGFNKWTNRCPLCRQPAGALRDMLAPFAAAVADRDYEVTRGMMATDQVLRNDIWNDIIRPKQALYAAGYSDEAHAVWWSEQIYEHLARRRAARVQSQTDEAYHYGT